MRNFVSTKKWVLWSPSKWALFHRTDPWYTSIYIRSKNRRTSSVSIQFGEGANAIKIGHRRYTFELFERVHSGVKRVWDGRRIGETRGEDGGENKWKEEMKEKTVLSGRLHKSVVFWETSEDYCTTFLALVPDIQQCVVI